MIRKLRMKNEMKYGVRGAGLLKLLFSVTLFFILHTSYLIPSLKAQGNVGIGTLSPDTSALLDLTSITRGLLVPRMTQNQRNNINAPAIGLLVFCTDSMSSLNPSTFYFYDGTSWVPFLATGWSVWSVLGNYGTTPLNSFLGTTDSQDFVIKTNNLERMRIFANGDLGLTNSDNTAQELRFYEPSGSGTAYTAFKAGNQDSNITYTLPSTDGNGAQLLATDGSGNLYWRTVDLLWERGSGTGSLFGLGSGNSASGAYAISAGQSSSASGTNSTAFGVDAVASGTASTVSGGEQDTASGSFSVVSGGYDNVAGPGSYASVGGGGSNKASGAYSVVAGGTNNTASGNYSTVLGGNDNSVSGNYSLAFGQLARVTQDNSIVFYDSSYSDSAHSGSKHPVYVGIGVQSPQQALDIRGNLQFSGALMPAGQAGTSGYVLASNGTSPPVWVSPITPANLYWSTFGNTGTNPSTYYLGTTDAKDFVIRTDGNQAVYINSTGQVGLGSISGAPPATHVLQSTYGGVADETAAIFGTATGATTNQAIGVWGNASNAQDGATGPIGVLATGSFNQTAGNTNVALQLNDGEFTMGRTTETDTSYSVVEPAADGTFYSSEGPSGVIEIPINSGSLSTYPPVADSFQNLGTVTIGNEYCSATSIIILNVQQKSNGGSCSFGPDCTQAQYFVDVDNRSTGMFDIRVGMIPLISSANNYCSSDNIRIGYVIINPGR